MLDKLAACDKAVRIATNSAIECRYISLTVNLIIVVIMHEMQYSYVNSKFIFFFYVKIGSSTCACIISSN